MAANKQACCNGNTETQFQSQAAPLSGHMVAGGGTQRLQSQKRIVVQHEGRRLDEECEKWQNGGDCLPQNASLIPQYAGANSLKSVLWIKAGG